jgi:quinol monooxygenase YgiN
MVQMLVRLTAAPGRAGHLVQALLSVQRSLDRAGACLESHVSTDAGNPNIVWYCEEWPDLAAFEQNVRSERFIRVLAVIETAAEAPLIECRVVSDIRGLAYIAGVRGVEVADAPNHV